MNKTLANNIAVAATLTSLNADKAAGIIGRRIAYLRSLGEDARNTAAWRDAVYEQNEFSRAIGCRTWHLRCAA
jgi:hypothetical protein